MITYNTVYTDGNHFVLFTDHKKIKQYTFR